MNQQERQKCLRGQYLTATEEEEESLELPEATSGREMGLDIFEERGSGHPAAR